MFDSALQKLERAETHLNQLEAEAREFFASNPYPISQEFHADSAYHRWRADVRKPFPDCWPFLVGDCVHNARSALDHLAWEAAGSVRDDTWTQFPIFGTSAKYSAERVKWLDDAGRKLVRESQPFFAPENKPLLAVQVLDAEDKHKKLAVLLALPDTQIVLASISNAAEGNVIHQDIQTRTDPINPATEPDAPIATCQMLVVPESGIGPPWPVMQMECHPQWELAFHAETTGLFMTGENALRETLLAVERVIRRFIEVEPKPRPRDAHKRPPRKRR